MAQSGASITLVSAPGAVGKSTYARQLAYELGLTLVDLSVASPVAGNYLSGGLVQTGLISAFQSGSASIVIDALDEARMRVTSASFAAFIADLARISQGSSSPIALFGREGAIEEAWLMFDQHGIQPAIYEIERFDELHALQFVTARLLARPDAERDRFLQFKEAYEGKAAELIKQLAAVTSGQDAAGPLEFAGYAPVLEAVSEYLAGLTNPSGPLEVAETGSALINTIVERILERETGKVIQPLRARFPEFESTKLYSPDEQRGRLVARLSGLTYPSPATNLREEAREAFEESVASLLPQHPFLDGSGMGTSSAVFEADLICTFLTGARGLVPANLQRYSKPGNPFVIDLYRARAERLGSAHLTPPEDIGHLFASAQALASAGQGAELLFDQSESDETAWVAIELREQGETESRARRWEFNSHVAGKISLLGNVGNIEIYGEVDVEIGDAQVGARLTAPVDVICTGLTILGDELLAAGDPLAARAKVGSGNAINLTSENVSANQLTRIRLVGHPILTVEFEGADQYPWSPYAVTTPYQDRTDLWKAKFALRRTLGVFRANNRGELSQSENKLASRRMSKGFGTEVQAGLVRDGVLIKSGKMYLLDSDRLGEIVGTSYMDVARRNFSDQAEKWLLAVLASTATGE